MAASRHPARKSALFGATAVCLGVGGAVCFSVAAAPAGAAGLADRIVSAQDSRSGTVYGSFRADGSDRRVPP
jgi:hypothetical protein